LWNVLPEKNPYLHGTIYPWRTLHQMVPEKMVLATWGHITSRHGP
jgi:hypothetical protein